MTDQLDYYRHRAAQERAIAAACDNSAVRHVHLELAARYAAQLADAELQAGRQPAELPAIDA